MADWIKMRSSLLTNPKVVRMARVLLEDPEFVEWLCPGMSVTRDETVTKRHVHVVTRIVVGALLPTWSAVNDSAARDGVLRHVASRDIDETAGVPGFGAALKSVEWLEDLPGGQGVRFVNFEEHNQPQKERSLTAKSPAERQREYRERKAREAAERNERNAGGDVARDVTVTSHSDDRIEKSREEKKNPSGSSAPQAARKAKKPVGSKRVPAEFGVSPELEAWSVEHAPLVDWRRETEKFRDWEFKHARTDWDATWRTWMRNAQEKAAETHGSGAQHGEATFV